MTPAYQDFLRRLSASGRLGPMCVWPGPPGMDPERNLIFPSSARVDEGGRVITDKEGRPVMAPSWEVNPPGECPAVIP